MNKKISPTEVSKKRSARFVRFVVELRVWFMSRFPTAKKVSSETVDINFPEVADSQLHTLCQNEHLHYNKQMVSLKKRWRRFTLNMVQTHMTTIYLDSAMAESRSAYLWSPHYKLVSNSECWRSPEKKPGVTRILTGNFYQYHTWFPGNYGHFIHDELPVIAFLKSRLSGSDRILLRYSKLSEAWLKWFDHGFERKVVWMNADDTLFINGTLTTLHANYLPNRNPYFIEYLKLWIGEKQSPAFQQATVIYYSRSGSRDTKHNRIMDSKNEAAIIETIKSAMLQYKRHEKLVVYNGIENGKTMSYENQFNLFRSATTLIGPHGSGMANSMWMIGGMNAKIASRQVIEFLPGKGSKHVQKRVYSKTYYNLSAGLSPIDYHHVPFTQDSTSQFTRIDLDDLKLALNAIWG